MAVTVEESSFVVLDEEYRIVEVASPAEATFGPLLGRHVFDCFVDAANLFRPYYDSARATDEVVEFAQYYDGYALLVTAKPLGDGQLGVSWEVLGTLDTMTLDGLRVSLAGILAKLEAHEKRTRLDHRRQSLQIIEGGA